MRKLNMKQRTLLSNVPRVTPAVISQLESLNDYETLTQDAIRFHTDLQLKRAQQHVYRCLNFNQSQLHQYDEKKFIKDWN